MSGGKEEEDGDGRTRRPRLEAVVIGEKEDRWMMMIRISWWLVSID